MNYQTVMPDHKVLTQRIQVGRVPERGGDRMASTCEKGTQEIIQILATL